MNSLTAIIASARVLYPLSGYVTNPLEVADLRSVDKKDFAPIRGLTRAF